MSIRACASFVVLGLLALPAGAADYYVDVVNGNDASAGLSPATAWKTLTHASQFSPSGVVTTIHAAPGTYSALTGEAFPLLFNDQRLVGDLGAAATIIDGGSPNTTIFYMGSPSPPSGPSSIEGFTLRNAWRAFDARSIWQSLTVTILDCRIELMSDAGIYALGWTGQGLPAVHLSIVRTTFDGMPFGVIHWGKYPVNVNLADCSFRNCATAGVQVQASGTTHLNVDRSRFEHNTGSGIVALATNYGRIHATIRNCLFAHNGTGFQAYAGGSEALASVEIASCTVADNLGAGVRIFGSQFAQGWFNNTIVHGNSPDLDVNNLETSVFTLIGSPDPQFVDRVNGDYRLRFGSPCIDSADPGLTLGLVDLAGVLRPIDGNLNTNERADMGALEHTPLRLVTSGQIGTPLRLEMSGQAGGTTTVYFTRGAPVSPASTPFGQFDLNPATFGTLLTSAVAPFPPVGFQRPIPNSPHLIGMTFSFQGLTSSTLAPQGFAYTNVVSFTVTP